MFLNIGGGNFQQDGWLNLDHWFESQAGKRNRDFIDVDHNLLSFDKIQLAANSIDGAYTEHCIEHIADKHVDHLFEEVKRILKTGAVFRISCPDADFFYDKYLAGEIQDINGRYRGTTGEFTFVSEIATVFAESKKFEAEAVRKILSIGGCRAKNLDEICKKVESISQAEQAKKPGGHISWWNFDKLTALLEKKGFRKIRLSSIRESHEPEFTKPFIDKTAQKYSIYVECAK